MAAKPNAYERVTNVILEQMQQGAVPWRKPWGLGGEPRNLKGRPYRGVNRLILGACAPYGSPWWGTYKAIKAAGGQVQRGEKGWPVVFFKWIDTTDKSTGEAKRIPLLRTYTVFNAEQCADLETEEAERPTSFDPIAECEGIVANYKGGPMLRHGANGAWYEPSTDQVRMPDPECFESVERYYTTLFHELGHSTGHSKRLARAGVTDPTRFGSHAYSREELCAELTASFLADTAGIGTEDTTQQAAAYLRNWMQALKADPKAMVIAAQQAQKAADHILGHVPTTDES